MQTQSFAVVFLFRPPVPGFVRDKMAAATKPRTPNSPSPLRFREPPSDAVLEAKTELSEILALYAQWEDVNQQRVTQRIRKLQATLASLNPDEFGQFQYIYYDCSPFQEMLRCQCFETGWTRLPITLRPTPLVMIPSLSSLICSRRKSVDFFG